MRDIISPVKSLPQTTTRPILPKSTGGVKCVNVQLGQEGWTRHQENGAKPPLKARPGWSVRRKRRRAGLTTPSAPLRNGIFFLMAQPPLLFQEGNTLARLRGLVMAVEESLLDVGAKFLHDI